MQRHCYVLPLILAVLSLSACGSPTPRDSGIAGMAQASGGGNEVTLKLAPDSYARIVVKAESGPAAGTVVAKVRADAGGLFRVSLPPGRYLVYGRTFPPGAVHVTVTAGHYADAAVLTVLLN